MATLGAQADRAPTQRDRHLQTIAQRGRGWQRATGYGRRSLAEAAMFRYKTLIGRLCAPGVCLDGRRSPGWAAP